MTKFRSPAEQAVHDDIAAQTAAGGDPFGDDEEIIAPSIESQAADAQTQLALENGTDAADADADDADDKPAEAKEGKDDTKAEVDKTAEGADGEGDTTDAAADADADASDETPIDQKALAALADEGDEDDDDEIAPAVQMQTADPKALAADKKTLVAEKGANLKKMMDGEMTPEEYAAADQRISDGLETIVIQTALIEQNAQNAVAAEHAGLRKIMTRAKGEGVDYAADQLAQGQFDAAMQALVRTPANKDKSLYAIQKQAHATVLAIRGIAKAQTSAADAAAAATAAAVAAAKPGKPPARVPGKAPVTLRDLPAASVSNTGGGPLEAIGTLTGAAYQAAYAKLTPAQKAALVDGD